MYYPLLERAENKQIRSNLNAYMFIIKKGEKSVGVYMGSRLNHLAEGHLYLIERVLWHKLLYVTILYDRSLEDTDPGSYKERFMTYQQAQIQA